MVGVTALSVVLDAMVEGELLLVALFGAGGAWMMGLGQDYGRIKVLP